MVRRARQVPDIFGVVGIESDAGTVRGSSIQYTENMHSKSRKTAIGICI
jgi:hypothetical protein